MNYRPESTGFPVELWLGYWKSYLLTMRVLSPHRFPGATQELNRLASLVYVGAIGRPDDAKPNRN